MFLKSINFLIFKKLGLEIVKLLDLQIHLTKLLNSEQIKFILRIKTADFAALCEQGYESELNFLFDHKAAHKGSTIIGPLCRYNCVEILKKYIAAYDINPYLALKQCLYYKFPKEICYYFCYKISEKFNDQSDIYSYIASYGSKALTKKMIELELFDNSEQAVYNLLILQVSSVKYLKFLEKKIFIPIANYRALFNDSVSYKNIKLLKYCLTKIDRVSIVELKRITSLKVFKLVTETFVPESELSLYANSPKIFDFLLEKWGKPHLGKVFLEIKRTNKLDILKKIFEQTNILERKKIIIRIICSSNHSFIEYIISEKFYELFRANEFFSFINSKFIGCLFEKKVPFNENLLCEMIIQDNSSHSVLKKISKIKEFVALDLFAEKFTIKCCEMNSKLKVLKFVCNHLRDPEAFNKKRFAQLAKPNSKIYDFLLE